MRVLALAYSSCDNSTDIANLKQILVFEKYFVKGIPQTQFLKVVVERLRL